MPAKYDRDKDAYECHEEEEAKELGEKYDPWFCRKAILTEFGVRFDTAEEIKMMLATVHHEYHGSGAHQDPNKAHWALKSYLNSYDLPVEVVSCYIKRLRKRRHEMQRDQAA